jgi:hypothetical protein
MADGRGSAEFRSPEMLILELPADASRSPSRSIGLPLGFDAVIGRGEAATVRIDDTRVSQQHARLVHTNRGVILTDLDSTNGTLVNDERVIGSSILQHGDRISFGGVSAVLRSAPIPVQHQFGGESPTPQQRSPAASEALPPEGPIGANAPLDNGPIPAMVDRGDAPTAARSQSANSFRGTVLKATTPVVNVNPYLVLDIRTEDGDTVAVRARFWLPFGVPYVAEGHHVLVTGHRTRAGFIQPDSIENETTGVRWRRRRLWVFVLALVVALAFVVTAFSLTSSGDPTVGPAPAGSGIIPSVVGKSLDVARAELSSAGFTNVLESRQRSRQPTFTVLKTTPAAGAEVSKDMQILVFFSFPL